MAKKPLRIADALGFGASRRDLTQTYRRAVERPATQYVGEVANPRRTYSQKIAQALTPNTKFGADIANRLSTFLDTFTPLGAEEPLVRARNAMGRGDYGDAAFQGALGILSGIPGAGGLEGKVAKGAVEKAVDRGLLDAAEKGIIAYHGSPHSFDKFDISKIGTGEGAQAYGHGLYFAEAEDVAKNYRDALKAKGAYNQEAKLDDPTRVAGELYESWNGDIRGALDDAKYYDNSKEIIKALKKIQENPPTGSMYQVRINANPEDFLDWDKSISGQSKKVQSVLNQYGIKNEPNLSEIKSQANGLLNIIKGVEGRAKWTDDAISEISQDVKTAKNPIDVYLAVKDVPMAFGIDPNSKLFSVISNDVMNSILDLKRFGDPAVSDAYRLQKEIEGSLGSPVEIQQKLNSSGIAGIKYLDQGSRGSGQGTRNYVVFDDALIDILKKYGIAIPFLAGGGLLSARPQQDGGL